MKVFFFKRNMFFLCCGFSLFLSLNPYFLWGSGGVIWYLIVLLTFVLFITTKQKITKKELFYSIFYLCISVFLGWSFSGFHLGASGPFNLLLGIIIILSFDNIKLIYKFYKKIFILALIPGVIVWFLLFFHIDVHAEILTAKNMAKTLNGTYYYEYPGSIFLNYTKYDIGSFQINRFSGMLDEPGFLGTLISLMLCVEKVDLSKKENVFLFFCGILTLSAAFFLICIIYVLLKSNLKTKIIIFFIMLFILMLTQGVPGLEYMIHDKLLNSLSGETNRNEFSIQYFFNELFKGDFLDILFGFGYGSFSNLGIDSSSLFVVLYDKGVIGIILLIQYIIFTPFVFCKKINYTALVFLFVYIVSLYQRPSILFGAMMIIFYFGLKESNYE